MTFIQIVAPDARASVAVAPPKWKGGIGLLCFWLVGVWLAISTAAPAQGNRLDGEQPAANSLTAPLKPYIDNHQLTGAVVLAANRDRVMARAAIGYADLAGRRIMRPDDVFWIASMSKAMTASAVMMLVDEGRIRLDDPMEKYLPEFKGQMVSILSRPAGTSSQRAAAAPDGKENPAGGLESPRHPITIRELLCHTSGLPFSSKREPGALDLLPLESAVESYAAEPLASQPGERYSYSNEGFNTAGRIVERVSGMPFDVFLEKRLFSPLGMKNTTFWPSRKQLRRLAKSYKSGAAGGDPQEAQISQLTYPLDDRVHRFPIPAGGLFSTADDVARFCQMMLNRGTFRGRRYLSEESVRLITTKETGETIAQAYGFGWNIGDGSFEHSGAYKTDMLVDEKNSLIVVLLVQRADEWQSADRERLMASIEKAALAGLNHGSPSHR